MAADLKGLQGADLGPRAWLSMDTLGTLVTLPVNSPFVCHLTVSCHVTPEGSRARDHCWGGRGHHACPRGSGFSLLSWVQGAGWSSQCLLVAPGCQVYSLSTSSTWGLMV